MTAWEQRNPLMPGEMADELADLLDRIEPVLEGHSRMIITLAATRLIAAMLGPASQESRQHYLENLPGAIRSLLNEMDQMWQ